jgi:hypothetical protein
MIQKAGQSQTDSPLQRAISPFSFHFVLVPTHSEIINPELTSKEIKNIFLFSVEQKKAQTFPFLYKRI